MNLSQGKHINCIKGAFFFLTESRKDKTRMTVWNKVMLPKTFSSPSDEGHSPLCVAAPFCCVAPFLGTLIWRWWTVPCPTCQGVPLNKAVTVNPSLIQVCHICGQESPFFIFVPSGRRISFFHSDASLLTSAAESRCVYSGVSVTCIYEKTIISLKLQHNSTVHVFRTNKRAYMAHWQHWVTDVSEHARFATKNHNLFSKLWHVTMARQHLGPKVTFDYRE